MRWGPCVVQAALVRTARRPRCGVLLPPGGPGAAAMGGHARHAGCFGTACLPACLPRPRGTAACPRPFPSCCPGTTRTRPSPLRLSSSSLTTSPLPLSTCCSLATAPLPLPTCCSLAAALPLLPSSCCSQAGDGPSGPPGLPPGGAGGRPALRPCAAAGVGPRGGGLGRRRCGAPPAGRNAGCHARHPAQPGGLARRPGSRYQGGGLCRWVGWGWQQWYRQAAAAVAQRLAGWMGSWLCAASAAQHGGCLCSDQRHEPGV